MIHIGLQKNVRGFDWLHTAQKKSFVTPIDINRASVNELLKVPGIGPKTAEFILSYKQLHGSFKDLEPLKDARGMSPQRYERLEKYLTVESKR